MALEVRKEQIKKQNFNSSFTFPYPSSNAKIDNDMFVASLLALIHPPNIPDLSPSIPHRLRWRTCFTSVAIPCWRAQYGRRAAIITSPPRRKDEKSPMSRERVVETYDERRKMPRVPFKGKDEKRMTSLTNSKPHVSLDFQGSFQGCRGYELKKALK